MRKVLEEAVVVANATARTISFAPRPEEGFAYYPDSQWLNMLFPAITSSSTRRHSSRPRA
jgi:hypothetical protein